MRQEMSVSRLLTELETLVEHHERQEAHHAEQEAYHREQRAAHAAGLQTARERLAAYRVAAEAAGELVARFQPPPPVEDDLRPGEPVLVSRLAARVVATKEPAETFSGASITRDVNQRYGKRLRRPAQVRTIATVLRRMAAAGRIHQVREGRAHHEATYTRGNPASPPATPI